jgi:hypothetical protein
MNRSAVAIALAAALAFTPLLAPVQAKPKEVSSSLQIPVGGAASTGEKFAGTFNLQRFVAANDQVLAVGTVAGTLTDMAGNVVGTTLQTVSIPVTVESGATSKSTAATTASSAAAAAAASCAILHLDLGPLHLNLLGLQVDLSRIVLDITAIPGAGNLLGNLLCGVANLLNNPSGLAQLLNQILDILNGL